MYYFNDFSTVKAAGADATAADAKVMKVGMVVEVEHPCY